MLLQYNSLYTKYVIFLVCLKQNNNKSKNTKYNSFTNLCRCSYNAYFTDEVCFFRLSNSFYLFYILRQNSSKTYSKPHFMA